MSFFNPLAKKDDGKKAPSPKRKERRAEQVGTVRVGGAGTGDEKHAAVLKNPRITEKASFITEDGAYTFDCHPNATKRDIARAVQEVYGVKPVKVRTVSLPAKYTYSRGRIGRTAGGKKAIVYLKKGERIEFI